MRLTKLLENVHHGPMTAPPSSSARPPLDPTGDTPDARTGAALADASAAAAVARGAYGEVNNSLVFQEISRGILNRRFDDGLQKSEH